MSFFLKQIRWGLLLCLCLSFIEVSKAQDSNKNQEFLTLVVYCPNNPSCIYSGEQKLYVYKKIINHTKYNLEIPMDAIQNYLINSDLKNMKTGELIGRIIPPPMPMPDLLKKLTVIPANSEIIMDGYFTDEGIKEGFYDAKSDQILYTVSFDIPAYYQCSEKPIGYYKDGKYEVKNFGLKSEIVITKKKGLRLGHVLKKKDRPVIVY